MVGISVRVGEEKTCIPDRAVTRPGMIADQ